MQENYKVGNENVRLTSDEGSKRRLPPWMLQKAGANHVSKSDNVVENNCITERGDLAQDPDLTENAGIALKEKAGTDQKRLSSKRKSRILAKRQVKTKNLSQRDGSSDNFPQREKRTRSSSRTRVLKSCTKKSQNVEDPSPCSCDVHPVQALSDDDIELTVEDLMAIAEEYVKDFEKKDQQEASGSGRWCESKKQYATTESGSTLHSSDKNKRSSAAMEDLYNSTPTTTGEVIASGTSQTGDPTQDMLDLFLGPLLKKPLAEEENKSIVEGLEFTHEFTRKSQDELVGEEVVPVTKKKSSLKDKVAMFLN